MQMQSVQSIEDKVEMNTVTPTGSVLSATVPRSGLTMAKALLAKLYQAHQQVNWHLEFQDDVIRFWSGMHLTFAYQMKFSELTKGFDNIRLRGIEMIARIQAGAI